MKVSVIFLSRSFATRFRFTQKLSVQFRTRLSRGQALNFWLDTNQTIMSTVAKVTRLVITFAGKTAKFWRIIRLNYCGETRVFHVLFCVIVRLPYLEFWVRVRAKTSCMVYVTNITVLACSCFCLRFSPTLL